MAKRQPTRCASRSRPRTGAPDLPVPGPDWLGTIFRDFGSFLVCFQAQAGPGRDFSRPAPQRCNAVGKHAMRGERGPRRWLSRVPRLFQGAMETQWEVPFFRNVGLVAAACCCLLLQTRKLTPLPDSSGETDIEYPKRVKTENVQK